MENKNKSDTAFAWIITIIIFSYFVTSPSINPFSNTATVYQLTCLEYPLKKIHECNKNDVLPVKKEFKVFAAQQQVIRFSGILVEKLDNCAVFDKKNWHCGFTQMVDGDYTRLYSDTNENEEEYSKEISRIRYTFEKIKIMLKNLS